MPPKKKKETAGELAPAPTSYDAILDHMQSAFSKDLIKKGADEKPYNGVGLSWGIPSLNYICTKNPFIGIVPGRIYEIFGPESSGKTTISLHAIAEALKVHGVAAFIDAEHALDPVYAKNLGVDMSRLIITQPDYGEQALDIAEAFVRQGTPLIVIDSVAALVPKAELDASNDKNHMGLQARMMSKALRKLTAITSKSHSTIIFINQTRMKIGVMFGNPETTTGGNALKFYASVRLDIHSSIAKDKAIVGNYKNLTGKQDVARLGTEMTIKAVKTKLTSPFQDTKLDILYGLGVDKNKDLFSFAVSNDLIERGRGAYKVKQGSKELRILDSEIDNHTDLIWELLKSKYK